LLLSKLELKGFKSFPNGTSLKFDEGIMGVVGPNGCGKTNILDSLRWVLGEQRSSMLRGSRVDEVLFNGTSRLRPQDMAEVNLTIKNNRGVLPLEYDEVKVSRRLFRSGESEYLINNARCRLKDIVELFSDTGMGTHAYSIFQQNMVDAVLSDKADERRFLFEEAAGITKYKNRKKEALKKLENTEIDLVRLGDIIAEISKNVRSLKRQATKARKYKNIREDLELLEIASASAILLDFETEKTTFAKRITDLQTERTGVNTSIDTEEASLEELKLKISGLNEQIASTASRAAALSEEAIHSENRLTNLKSRLESGQQNASGWQGEIEQLEKRIELLNSQKSNSLNQQADCDQRLQVLKAELEANENSVGGSKQLLESTDQKLEQLKTDFYQNENMLSGYQARLEEIVNTHQKLKEAGQNINLSLNEYRQKKEQSTNGLESQKAKLSECLSEIESFDLKIQENQRSHLKTVEEIEVLKKDISECNSQKSGLAVKIEMLNRMVLEHEGYGSGIKSVFKWADRPAGVIDTVANMITVTPEYQAAVESALNSYEQMVVCNTKSDALECIDYLNANSSGRVSFLVLENLDTGALANQRSKSAEALGFLTDFIDTEPRLKQALAALTGNTQVFKPESAIGSDTIEAVDLNGRYYNGRGVIHGGKSTISLVGRKSELDELDTKIKDMNSRLENLQTELNIKNDYLNRLIEDSNSLNGSQTKQKRLQQELTAEMTRLEFEFNENNNWLERLNVDNSETDKQLTTLDEQKSELEKKIVEASGHKAEFDLALEQAKDNHRQNQVNYQATVDRLNKVRLEIVELNGQIQKNSSDAERFSEMIEEASRMIGQKQAAIESEKQRWDGFESEQKSIQEQLSNLFLNRDNINAERDEFSNQKNIQSEKLNGSEARLKQYRSELNHLNDTVHAEELKQTELANSINNLKDKIYHEYGTQITGKRDDDFDEQKIKREIEKLKQLTESIGMVNMLADEEYTTEKDRLEFLEKQYKDLLDAKGQLVEVIAKINKTAEEKFTETFDMVKDNFQEVFESLFAGGVAEISLTDPDDKLNSPINIIARPGSKKLVSVNQLSGGERALTAISLLFAIYMVKPSPFCILDEIDAPLDDANVNRFIKMINRFTDNTQFIVITHNKKTMEAADLLYGVTMEQPGVSSIVSVKLNSSR